MSAEHIAAMSADIITIAYGASCWTRTPHSTGMVEEGLRAFLDVVRMDHPTTPIVVMSPVVRPDAEDTTNKLGASLADIRHAIESVTRERIVAGDATLSLVAGAGVISPEHLADGIHPGDEGHKRIAAALGKALTSAMRYREAPGVTEMLSESLPNLGMTVITGDPSDDDEVEDADVDVTTEVTDEVDVIDGVDAIDAIDGVDATDAADGVDGVEEATTDDGTEREAEPSLS